MVLLVSNTRRMGDDLAAPDQGDLVYLRIADDIASRISSGSLAPGTRLRSERDLAEHYEAAVGTIRRAMAVLHERGLIESIHGRGTYVRGQA